MSPRLESRRALSPVALVVAVLSLVAGMLTFAPATPAQAASLPGSILEGGFIISDGEFFDSDSLTASQIQTFLNARVSTCRAQSGDPTCLKNFKTDLPKIAADKYCKAIAAKSGATAAQVIAAAAAACGINPKVILVMLQKEQGLVTSSAPSEWSYRAAMGQACPDTAPCDEAAAGFVNQVYKGARQLQVYTQNPNSFNYRAGQVNTIKWHPTSSCGSSKVFIQNQATANLYIYTPYRPNVAALAAGSGTGDSCSTYGNRNFYNYYVSWFAPGSSTSTGSPAQVAACTVPPSADIAALSGSATVMSSTTGKKAPTKNCTTSATSLTKGAKVSVTGAYGAWVRVGSGSSARWVLRSALSLTTTGSPAAGGSACSLPSESSVTKASGTAVVSTSTLNARKAPSTSCDTGKKQITMGASYPRTATYGVWWRIMISGSPYWVHSAYTALEADNPAPVPTPVPNPGPGETQTNASVALRASASKTGQIITQLEMGRTVKVTETLGGWSKLLIGRRTGWVPTSYLVTGPSEPTAPTPPTTPTTPTTGEKQTNASVDLRASASKTGRIITRLETGRTVKVTEINGGWSKLLIGRRTGWVPSSYLTAVTAPTAPATPTQPTTTEKKTNGAVDLRSSASKTGRVITELAKGRVVIVTETKGGWSKLLIGRRTGWVPSSYLTTAAAFTPRTTTTTASVNLRASASTTARVITVLAKGRTVTVTAVSGSWSKLAIGGRTGWVHSDYLK